MYYFSIGAIFKNEAHILQEWLEHYFYHGVEHIYLINDKSTDNFLPILKPYIDKNLVTLYNCEDNRKEIGMQASKYNKFFHDIIKNSFWFGVLDLDEFLFKNRIYIFMIIFLYNKDSVIMGRGSLKKFL